MPKINKVRTFSSVLIKIPTTTVSMETLRSEEKTEKRSNPGLTTDLIKNGIVFPIKSDGLLYSELLNSIKTGGVRALAND